MTIKNLINELSAEDTINLFSWMLNEKVDLISKFYPSDGDIVTHMSLVCYCDDYVAETEPEELGIPLTPVAIKAVYAKNEIN